MNQSTLYRRPLPDDLVAFSSTEGRGIFREALQDGTLEGWFALAEQFHTQADPAFCGLGSLVVALNALGIDPQRLWKGPWRWFSEELLDCCVSLDVVKTRGLTLPELACLARCNGVRAEAHYATESNEDELRAALDGATRGGGTVIIAAYGRRPLGQTGGGHYSPIGGSHRGRDLALLLDVARFKYPPHWVPIRRLHRAMNEIDADTSRPRGWIELARQSAAGGLLASIACGTRPWSEVAQLFTRTPARWRSAPPIDLGGALAMLAEESRAIGAHLRFRDPIDAAHAQVIDRLKAGLRESPAGRALGRHGVTADLAAALLYTLSAEDFAALPQAIAAELRALADLAPLGDELAAEVTRLREQLASLRSS